MALTGNTVASTYLDLLRVSNSNSGIDGTARSIEDGKGTVSAAKISTAGVTEVVAQETGGTDRSYATIFEAQKFTMSGTVMGSFTIRMKRTGTITAGTVKGYLWTDSAGEPSADISDTSTGMPTILYAEDLSTSFGEIEFRMPKTGLTNGASYWMVFFFDGIAGGGSVQFDTQVAGTDIFATSAGGAWTTYSNIQLWHKVNTQADDAIYVESSNSVGLHGYSLTGFGGFFESVFGNGAKFQSQHGFGIGASSVHGNAGRFTSVNGIAFTAISTGSAGGQIQTTAASQAGLQIVSTSGPVIQAICTSTGAGFSLLESPSYSETMNINSQGLIDYKGTMGNSTKDPTIDAPVDWIECKIGGTARYIPVYAAS